MEWTRERPTKAGIYWWWEEGHDKPQVVEIWEWWDPQWEHEVQYMGTEMTGKISTVEGYWYGPLVAPDTPPVDTPPAE